VDAKKASTRRQSARYLLYADKALQTISLRRISVRPKKARKAPAPSRTKKPAAGGTTRPRTEAKSARPEVKTPRQDVKCPRQEVKTPRPEAKTPRAEVKTPRPEVKTPRPMKPSMSQATADRWWISFGVVCVVGIMVLMGVPSLSRRSAGVSKVAPADETLPKESVEPPPIDDAKPAPRPTAPRAVTARPAAAPSNAWVSVPAKPHLAEPAKVAVAEPVKTNTAEPAKAPSSTPAAPTPVGATASVAAAAVTTIQGCLQSGDDGFWLKSTSGADAPKARSWKSGFLTKRSAAIEVVDAGNSLRLSNHVGQRVAATGTLTDRRMQAHSLYTVAASCD
jgi:hypothetical protein